MSSRYKQSESFYERSVQSIPLASQTFSKSVTNWPKGASPLFLERGKGATVWDIDGNEYIDFINSLLAVSMGYADEDVDAAIVEQLKNGISFTMAHRLETEVAEKIIEMVPCAEMVRFGKNGTDATSAAIRLARAHTGRDRVFVCGYHGWQDWYIGSTARDLGVPESVKELTDSFQYNNIDSLTELFLKYPDDVAAVIMEPMNVEYPTDNFLEKVKELTHRYGAVLIFDEVITGFRFARGGAQELLGVTPDLTSMGKGLANGMPLSVIAGRRDIMMLMEDIFFSGTFGGETLSLAAAKAVLDKIENKNALEKINATGSLLMSECQKLLVELKLEDMFFLGGSPSWSFIRSKNFNGYTDLEIKTLMIQELLKAGFLTSGTHNISYAHNEQHVIRLVASYRIILPYIKTVVIEGRLLDVLETEPLKPLFTLRK